MAQTLPNQAKRLQCTCRTLAGVAYNPAALTLTVFLAVGDDWALQDTYAINQLTTSGTGVFYRDYTPGEGGAWRYVFQSDDGIHAADRFDVAYE